VPGFSFPEATGSMDHVALKTESYTVTLAAEARRVCVTGIPKSGTHALLKAVEMMGVPVGEGKAHIDVETLPAEPGHVYHCHIPPQELPGDCRTIVMLREPRNALVSYARFRYGVVTAGNLRLSLLDFFDFSFPEWLRKFIDYRESECLPIRFDDLLTDGGESVERIGKYIDAFDTTDVYKNINGQTVTYTGRLSNWQDHWTQRLEKEWRDTGCADLAGRYGYG